MSYFQISNFKAGLDLRRSELTSVPGALAQLVNAHINQGGEVEKRMAFVLNETLPVGTGYTFGLQPAPDGIYVFGSASSATVGALTAPYKYQQLVHPDGTETMTAVLSSTLYGSYPFVIAQFSNGDVFPFYAGSIVGDFIAGLILTYVNNNPVAIATNLTAAINSTSSTSGYVANQCSVVTAAAVTTAGSGYSVNQLLTVLGGVGSAAVLKVATVSGSGVATVTVQSAGAYTTLPANPVSVGTGAAKFNLTTTLGSIIDLSTPSGSSFTTALTQVSAAGTLTETVLNSGSLAVAAAPATGQFTISMGQAGGQLTQVNVNGVNILSAAVNWSVSNGYTATLVVAAINSGQTTYIASANGNVVTITTVIADATADGFVVQTVTTGGFCIGNCSATFVLNSSFTSIPAGSYVDTATSKTFILDGAGVSLLSTPSGTYSNSAWASVSAAVVSLAATINSVAGSVYCAATDGVASLWISQKTTSSIDATIVITINPGTYFSTTAVGGTGMVATVTPAALYIKLPGAVNHYPMSVAVSGGTPPYSYDWTLTSQYFPSNSTFANWIRFINSQGVAVSEVLTANVSVFWYLNGGRLVGQGNADAKGLTLKVTDSTNSTTTIIIPVTLGF